MSIKLQDHLKGAIFIFTSVIITSAATPFISKLIKIGADHTINNDNPISFCNVLFAGSLVAFVTLCILYFNDLKTFNPKSLSKDNWVIILSTAFISGFLVPTLYFLGIKYGNIINVILISTLQTPLYILAGWLVRGEKPRKMTFLAALFTMSGVILIVVLQNMTHSSSPSITQTTNNPTIQSYATSIPYFGEVCIFLAVILKVIGSLVSFRAINTITTGIYNTLSMIFGIIFFFSVTVILFGWHHFADLFSEFLWGWMLVYGAIIIALPTYLKFKGMKFSSLTEIAISQSLIPLSSIFFSYLILGVLPKTSQYFGGILIFIGLGMSLVCKLKVDKKATIEFPKPGPSGL